MSKSIAVQKYDSFRDLLKAYEGQFRDVCGTPEMTRALIRTGLSALASNKDLLDCTEQSILAALLYCAKIRLPPTGRGGVWLVPFKRVVTPITDYRGEITLAMRSGHVVSVRGVLIRSHDEFEYVESKNNAIFHKPAFLKKNDKGEWEEVARGEVVGVYAKATMRDGSKMYEALTNTDVRKYQSRSRAKDSQYSPWNTDWDAMAKKTAVRRLCNWLPQLEEYAQHVEAEVAMDERGEPPPVTYDLTTGEIVDGAPEPPPPKARNGKKPPAQKEAPPPPPPPPTQTNKAPLTADPPRPAATDNTAQAASIVQMAQRAQLSEKLVSLVAEAGGAIESMDKLPAQTLTQISMKLAAAAMGDRDDAPTD